MKLQKAFVCLITSGLLVAPTATQEAAQQKEPATQAASGKETSTNPKEKENGKHAVPEKDAVPEKIVAEKDAIKQLVGDYRIVSGENSGKELLPERLTDVTVRFTEKTVTTYDAERNARFSATYRLDTQKRPWRIMMTSTPRTANANAAQSGAGASPVADTSQGLVELAEEGRVKVIYALPGGTAPRDFKTGDRQQLFVLERILDTVEKAKEAAASKEAASPDKGQ